MQMNETTLKAPLDASQAKKNIISILQWCENIHFPIIKWGPSDLFQH